MLAATLIIVGIQIFFSSFLSQHPRPAPPGLRVPRRAVPLAAAVALLVALAVVLTELEAAPSGQQLRARVGRGGPHTRGRRAVPEGGRFSRRTRARSASCSAPTESPRRRSRSGRARGREAPHHRDAARGRARGPRGRPPAPRGRTPRPAPAYACACAAPGARFSTAPRPRCAWSGCARAARRWLSMRPGGGPPLRLRQGQPVRLRRSSGWRRWSCWRAWAMAGRLLARELRQMRRLPVAARWCAVIAFANALVWSVVTPPFHVPDETGHVAYLQYLAETGHDPRTSRARTCSPTTRSTVLDGIAFTGWSGSRATARRSPSSRTTWRRSAAGGSANRTGRAARWRPRTSRRSSTPTRPLGYLASPWKGLLDRLWLMRIMSALLAGSPSCSSTSSCASSSREPWTWTVGALAVAFQPVFGFIGSGVTPDSLLFTTSAALFFMLARPSGAA